MSLISSTSTNSRAISNEAAGGLDGVEPDVAGMRAAPACWQRQVTPLPPKKVGNEHTSVGGEYMMRSINASGFAWRSLNALQLAIYKYPVIADVRALPGKSSIDLERMPPVFVIVILPSRLKRSMASQAAFSKASDSLYTEVVTAAGRLRGQICRPSGDHRGQSGCASNIRIIIG